MTVHETLLLVGGNEESRGQAITRRRRALGYAKARPFARAVEDSIGMRRNTVAAAEKDRASERTYRRLEKWLDEQEAKSAGNEQVEIVVKGETFSLKGHVELSRTDEDQPADD